MKTHKQIYKQYGIHGASSFLNPKSFKTGDFIFPENSIFFYNPNEATLSTPSKQVGFLKDVDYLQVPYPEPFLPIGKFDIKLSNQNVFTELSRISTVKTLSSEKLLGVVKSKSTIVFNATTLDIRLRYRTYYGRIIDSYHNKWKTALYLCKTTYLRSTRKRYIQVPIPMMDLHIFKQLEDGVKTSFIKMEKKLPEDDRAFNLIEIWKMLSPNFGESPFDILTEDEMRNTFLIFDHNLQGTLISVFDLFSIAKQLKMNNDYNLDLDYTHARKLIFTYLLKFTVTTRKQISSPTDKKDLETGTSNISTVKQTDDEDVDIVDYISDEVLNTEIENETGTNIKTEVKVIKEVPKMDIKSLNRKKINRYESIDDAIRTGAITEVEAKNFRKRFDEQKKTGILDSIKVTKDDLQIDNPKLIDSGVVKEKDSLIDTNAALEKKYIKSVYKKDMLSSIYHLQNAGVIIKSVEFETKSDITGEWEYIKIAMQPIGGKQSTITIRIPKLQENGVVKTNGNTYYPIKQIVDKPIRKVTNKKVTLSSYSGKLSILKAKYATTDRSLQLLKLLQKAVKDENHKLTILVNLPSSIVSTEINMSYIYFSRNIKVLLMDGVELRFDYVNRKDILIGKDILEDVEKDGRLLIGRHNNKYITLSKDNMLYFDDKPFKNIYDFLEIDVSKIVMEFSSIQIFKQLVPSVLILSYQLGLTNLLHVLNVDYSQHELKERLIPEPNDIVVKFLNNQFWFKNLNALQMMIIGGFQNIEKFTKNVNSVTLDNKGTNILMLMGLEVKHIQEISTMETLFLDPITISVLEEMKEPTNIPALFIRASELLTTDYYSHTNDMTQMRIRGHERIPGLIYKHLNKAVKAQRVRAINGKSAVEIGMYDVWAEFANDSTLMLQEDLNPISTLKQRHEVTYTGFGGRNIDTMTAPTREFHKSQIGIVSEASKDSSKVGATIYLVASPMFKSLRGGKVTKKYNEETTADKFSISALIAAYGLGDDPKRLNFVSIQDQHVQGSMLYDILPTRTGFEAVIPQRLPEDYCLISKEDGVVLKVDKSNITIKYKNGDISNYTLRSWTSKEENNKTYEHKILTDLKEGQKIKEGDAIYWDALFFHRDMLNPSSIALKMGMLLNTGYFETYSTYEDSYELTKSGKEKLPTENVEIEDIRVDVDLELVQYLNVGDSVDISGNLITLSNSKEITNEHISLLQDLSKSTLISSTEGEIIDIRVRYFCELEDMSKTVRKFVENLNKDLAIKTGNPNITGQVDNTYSSKGLPIEPGTMIVSYYIRTKYPTSFGNKVRFGKQLKTTLGEVSNKDVSLDGIPIDAYFGTTGDSARIVTSSTKTGLMNTHQYFLTKKFLEIFDTE